VKPKSDVSHDGGHSTVCALSENSAVDVWSEVESTSLEKLAKAHQNFQTPTKIKVGNLMETMDSWNSANWTWGHINPDQGSGRCFKNIHLSSGDNAKTVMTTVLSEWNKTSANFVLHNYAQHE
jgi:hypothetical protein